MPDPLSIDADGIWFQVFEDAPAETHRAALFLDRDGVIVEEVGHLCRVEDVRLVAGAGDTIAAANTLNIPVVVVTNQSGIGQGLFDWLDFFAVQKEIARRLGALGARIDAVFACPFHPSGRPPYRHPDHPARKPNPGMVIAAARRLRLDLGASWIVGDRVRDLLAGRNAGLAGGMLVGTGYGGKAEEREALKAVDGAAEFAVRTGNSIADARTLPLFR
ncbi:MAG: HAD-IIIA family hydrolase [Rhodospirillales bacterium]|nr:HAD-IIIA family hydrolase [Rhodospirillales bacterium]